MKEKSRQSGFSLIELMIALVILAVGILGIAQLQVAAIRSLTLSRHTTMATQLAQRHAEWLRSLPVDLTNPATPPKGTGGAAIVDDQSQSVLLDINGLSAMSPTSWHWYQDPRNELGVKASGGEMEFYMRWSIERCCVGTAEATYDSATRVLQVPGTDQIEIYIQVFWWESNKHKPSPLTNLGSFDTRVLGSTNGHMVELRTIRTADL